ncbi:hypothetical protein GN956_G18247 [Arapaima gigas]
MTSLAALVVSLLRRRSNIKDGGRRQSVLWGSYQTVLSVFLPNRRTAGGKQVEAGGLFLKSGLSPTRRDPPAVPRHVSPFAGGGSCCRH